nr:protein FAR1-RELATED SEQUENCE 6-like isoform X1 [Coffea arabica]XP_027079891.1 protein FAR1-RELATED SEQUENCE 6-like isoform X1 [Coffea arabica]
MLILSFFSTFHFFYLAFSLFETFMSSSVSLLLQMEVVCLNSEPAFNEGDEYEHEGDSATGENADELCAAPHLKREPPPPTVGLEFDSFDEAYDFYNGYAKDQGFGIRVSNSWFRSKRKERYRAKLSCSSAGFKKKSEANNPRPETRTGCPAMIVIKLVDSKRWRIVEVELQHNHLVSPEIKRFYKSHKKMILAAQKSQQAEPVKEIHTIKLYRTSVINAAPNGYSKVKERDVRHPTDHSKHLELKEGDAHAVYNYFCRMKLTNPNFFYLMDLDDEGRLKNIFWADARSRSAYIYFSDAIAIDTTCLTNKYELPLVSFVGVNHHGQSVLLGCGFLGHESVEYFVWMFRSWLTCMLGRHPRVILTDQSKSLQMAISEVFPGTRHCYCLSYIMQRVPEKLGGLRGYEAIRKQLNQAVYNSMKIAEFETAWGSMVGQHGLGENKWLQSLHEDRQRWVPVYIKDTSFVGMIPVKENEVSKPLFDGYVHKHTSFKEFLDKNDLALQRKLMKEATGDTESRNCSFELRTKCNFELQLSKVYTKQIFEKFQIEVEGMYSCFNTRQVNINGPIITYAVKERVEVEESEKEVRQYEVLYETTNMEIRCICSLFNFRGYLCRHALNVFNYNGVEEIPSQYILPRWSKDYKRRFPLDPFPNDVDLNDYVLRYNHLLSRAIQVIEEGAQSRECWKASLQGLEELCRKFALENVDEVYL